LGSFSRVRNYSLYVSFGECAAFTRFDSSIQTIFELAAIYEKSSWQLLWQVLVPASLPAMSVPLASASIAWLAVALAEKAVAEWLTGVLATIFFAPKNKDSLPICRQCDRSCIASLDAGLGSQKDRAKGIQVVNTVGALDAREEQT